MKMTKRNIKELMVGIVSIIEREEFTGVDIIAKELNSNWSTINNYCEILNEIGFIKMKLLNKTKVVTLSKK